MNSVITSSHLLLVLGLPIALYVLCLELSSRFHSATFTIHLSLGRDATLSASLHFILLWVSIQHRIFAFSIFSMASSLLLFVYSIHSSSSISVVSISSSVSLSKEMSLSWSLCVFEPHLFVSRSFCISFSIVWWVEALCVASIESFFHALLWVSRHQRRSSSSGIPLRRKAQMDV